MASIKLPKILCGSLLLIVAGSLFDARGQTPDSSLSTDQVAVYRAFLSTCPASEKGPGKVADLVLPLDMSSPMFGVCFKDFGESTHQALSAAVLSEEVTKDLNFQLVHVEQKPQASVKPDPNMGETMVFPPALYENSSFDDGSLLFSNIIFSSDRRYAVFEVLRIEICARCGSESSYLVYENNDGKWSSTPTGLCGTAHMIID